MGHVAAEMLEDRIVLSAAAVTPPVDANVEANVDAELATITDITVNEVEVTGENEATANATLTGTALGSEFTQDVEIPITLDVTEGETSDGEPTDILNLAVGPVHLDILGLNVNLDDCEGGPVTVDVTAIPGEGNLLGNLLSDIAGALDEDGGLANLTDEQTDTLTTGLTELLGGTGTDAGLLDTFLAEAEPTQTNDSNGDVTDILTLEIPEGLEVDLLGLNVQTSGICLEVTAEEGEGNLLGNLLGSLSGLLDQSDDLDGTLESLGSSLTDLTNALVDRIGEIEDLENLPEDLSESIEDLTEELNDVERLVSRLDGQDRVDDAQIDEVVSDFTAQIDEVTSQLAEAGDDELAGLVDDLEGIVDDLGDDVKDLARGGNNDDDDEEEDDEDDDESDNGPLAGAIDRLNEIIERFEERDDDRFERVIEPLNDVVDRLEELAGINGDDDGEEDARGELFASGEVTGRLLVGA